MNRRSGDPNGIALLCDASGIVSQIFRDDLHVAHDLRVGGSIFDLIDASSRAKCRNLLSELREQKLAFAWEMDVFASGRTMSLHFAGAAADDDFLIVGHGTSHSEYLFESIADINGEQATQLRRALKDRTMISRAREHREASQLDELSLVNNELVNLQRELTQKNRELRLLNDQRNELLGMAAHDLRNPLGVVMAFSRFLLTECAGPVNEQQAKLLANINSSSHFMLRMVEDLLDISQIEAGKLRLDLATVDLRTLLVGNISLNGVIAEKKGVALDFVCDAADAEVTADSGKIEQVFNNLISNAIKFSRPATRVVVTLSPDPIGFLIEVRDQGQGIPALELDRLFHPFFRTSVESTGGEKSTGLGLAIVQRIVGGHGGKVWVESEVGVGTSFRVLLPLAAPAMTPLRLAIPAPTVVAA